MAKSKKNTSQSSIIQAGVVFIVLAAIIIVAYVIKNYT